MNPIGTDVFIYDAQESLIREIGCITHMDEVGDAIEAYEVATLCDKSEVHIPGHELREQVQLIVSMKDARELRQVMRGRRPVRWVVGHSGDATKPRISRGQLVLSQNREWVTFDGFIVSIKWDYEAGARTMAAVVVQTTSRTDYTNVTKVPWAQGEPWAGGIYWR